MEQNKKEIHGEILTDTDSDLWYKPFWDAEDNIGINIETTKGVEAQSSCVGTPLNTLIPHLNPRIDAVVQIILEKNKKDNKGKDKNKKEEMTKSVQILKDYSYNWKLGHSRRNHRISVNRTIS